MALASIAKRVAGDTVMMVNKWASVINCNEKYQQAWRNERRKHQRGSERKSSGESESSEKHGGGVISERKRNGNGMLAKAAKISKMAAGGSSA